MIFQNITADTVSIPSLGLIVPSTGTFADPSGTGAGFVLQCATGGEFAPYDSAAITATAAAVAAYNASLPINPPPAPTVLTSANYTAYLPSGVGNAFAVADL